MKRNVLTRLLSLVLAAVLSLPLAVFAGADGTGLTLREGSRLTLDAKSGYLRGIYDKVTADTLTAYFDGDVTVTAPDGTVLTGKTGVPADSTVTAGDESILVLIYGDVNRDAKITVSDVTALLKRIAAWDVDICVAAADVTSDGKITVSDVTTLLKYIAVWDVMLGDSVYPEREFRIDESFAVVISANADESEQDAANLMCTALDTVYGTSVGRKRLITASSTSFNEILIGNTGRTRSTDAIKSLGEFDYTYSVPTDRCIVISGKDGEGTYEAACEFLWNTFGYVNKCNVMGSYDKWTGTEYIKTEAKTTLSTGDGYTYRHKTVCTSAAFGEYPLDGYTVVCSDAHAGAIISRAVKKLTGTAIPVKTAAEYTSGDALFVGMAAKDGSHLDDVKGNVFAYAASGRDVMVDTEAGDEVFAARAFANRFLSDYDKTEDVIAVPALELAGVDSNILVLEETESRTVADGVTYTKLDYVDTHGMPVVAHVITAEKGGEYLVMGTPDGKTIGGVSANVRQMMQKKADAGENVIAGINADFFHIESDYSPQGLCVLDGEVLKTNNETRPWFAIMKDGTFRTGIGSDARMYINDMQLGVGASHVLLKKDLVYQDGLGTSFGDIRHPRTALGYDGDGNVYFIVVDGRQPEISNGASLLDLTLMLKSLGASDAVNLDGGGSSTMIINEDGFNVMNSPSDGALRSIFSSLMIIK